MSAPEFNDELLSAYLDGELTGDEQARVEQALEQSAEHRQTLDELRALRSGLESLPNYQLDAGFHRRVLQQAERAMLRGTGTSPAEEAGASGADDVRSVAETDAQPKVALSGDYRNWRAVIATVAAAAAVLLIVVWGPFASNETDPSGNGEGVAVVDEESDEPAGEVEEGVSGNGTAPGVARGSLNDQGSLENNARPDTGGEGLEQIDADREPDPQDPTPQVVAVPPSEPEGAHPVAPQATPSAVLDMIPRGIEAMNRAVESIAEAGGSQAAEMIVEVAITQEQFDDILQLYSISYDQGQIDLVLAGEARALENAAAAPRQWQAGEEQLQRQAAVPEQQQGALAAAIPASDESGLVVVEATAEQVTAVLTQLAQSSDKMAWAQLEYREDAAPLLAMRDVTPPANGAMAGRRGAGGAIDNDFAGDSAAPPTGEGQGSSQGQAVADDEQLDAFGVDEFAPADEPAADVLPADAGHDVADDAEAESLDQSPLPEPDDVPRPAAAAPGEGVESRRATGARSRAMRLDEAEREAMRELTEALARDHRQARTAQAPQAIEQDRVEDAEEFFAPTEQTPAAESEPQTDAFRDGADGVNPFAEEVASAEPLVRVVFVIRPPTSTVGPAIAAEEPTGDPEASEAEQPTDE